MSSPSLQRPTAISLLFLFRTASCPEERLAYGRAVSSCAICRFSDPNDFRYLRCHAISAFHVDRMRWGERQIRMAINTQFNGAHYPTRQLCRNALGRKLLEGRESFL